MKKSFTQYKICNSVMRNGKIYVHHISRVVLTFFYMLFIFYDVLHNENVLFKSSIKHYKTASFKEALSERHERETRNHV